MFRPAVILFSLIFLLGWFWESPYKKKNAEGNKLYNEGKIDEALSKYRDAQIQNPDSKELHYNIGNGLHENKKYEDSLKEYEKALDAKDVKLLAKTYYNIGNTHYRLVKLPEAIKDYEKCLDLDPTDEDAKYNIEFIRKKLKEQAKSQEQRAQAEEKTKEEAKQEQRFSEEKKQEAEAQRLEEQKGQKEGEMPKEDALRLLDAMKDDEKTLQKELRRQPIEGEYRVEKDW